MGPQQHVSICARATLLPSVFVSTTMGRSSEVLAVTGGRFRDKQSFLRDVSLLGGQL